VEWEAESRWKSYADSTVECIQKPSKC
jgi:hypothetical protein